MMDETVCVWIQTYMRLAPSKPTIVSTPTSSNLLAASVELWQNPGRDENDVDADPATSTRPFIISTGADRQMHLLETIPGNEAITSFSGLSDSPVLSFVSILKGRYILMTNMSGHLLLQRGLEILQSRKDHAKYAVEVVVHEELDKTGSAKVFWVATAGWDATVFLYRMTISGDQASASVLGDPVARIKLATNPESLLFVRHVDTGELLLLVSRRDSSYIYYYQAESSLQNSTEQSNAQSSPRECRLLGQQNLAPHSNAWVAFSPSHMALSPLDPGLLAVATSSEPHMRVIIVRLLFPSTTPLNAPNQSTPDAAVTQASQALEALALQNREDAAILIQANTFAPQTSYSTPQVAWRPDGSGVWVNGDDGVVRGIDIKTGKVVALLKDGHEPGSKVRTIWAGYVAVPDEGDTAQEEWVISGGFDKRLIVWKV
jgi:WD40 repeat protein